MSSLMAVRADAVREALDNFPVLLLDLDAGRALHILGIGRLQFRRRARLLAEWRGLCMALWRLALWRSFPEHAEAMSRQFRESFGQSHTDKTSALALERAPAYWEVLAERGDADFRPVSLFRGRGPRTGHGPAPDAACAANLSIHFRPSYLSNWTIMDTSPSASPRATAVTIGNFDGVHQGHQVLIRRALTYSQQFGLDCVVITFWPHPRVLFGRPHQPLTSRAARMRLLQGLGDLRVLELPFTHELAALSPEEFVRQHLLPLRLKHLVIGHDFTLGRGRSGQPDVLRALGEKYGFDVDQLPPVEVGGHVVSSTCLRELIGKGDVATAASLLGHAYGCEGLVVHGEGRGTGLGFPTANIAIPDTMLPAPGVYATRVVVPHLGKTLQAVTNIGRKPTFGDYGLSIESFLLDTDLNLYGSELRLDFVARLRDEKRFDSADALVAQIRTDVARARDLLTMYF